MEVDRIIDGSLVDTIVLEMNKVHPESKYSNGTDYKQIATEYFDICVMELLNNLTNNNQVSEVSLSGIKSKFNYRYNKNQYWWNYLFTNYPVWLEIQKGYSVSSTNKQLTQIKPLVSIRDLMHYRMNRDFGDYYRSTVDRTPGLCVYTPIDQESLRNYQRVCAEQEQYKNIVLCQNILDQMERSPTGTDCIISNAECKHNVIGQSRVYYSGANNLQGMKRVVREAALGKCYKYDINSSVFAYMYHVIKTQDSGIRLPYMIDLLERKDYIRKVLATECLTATNTTPEHKLKIIKSSLTALSFGSNPHSWSSGIAEHIFNNADRERFATHEFVTGIMSEIKQYQAIIRSQFPKADYPGVKLVTLCSNHYQSCEALAIQEIVLALNLNPALLVHDCLYVKQRMDIVEATVTLQDYMGKYAKFGRDELKPWQDRSNWDQNDIAQAEHQQRISQEERDAVYHQSTNNIFG